MNLRPYREQDFDELHRLLEAASQVTRGERYPPEELRTWLATPTVNVATDVRLAVDGDRLVGYGDVDRNGDTWYADIRVLPGEDVDAVVPVLVTWAEQRVGSGRLRVWAAATDERLRETYERLALVPVRHSYGMMVDLVGNESAIWPDGLAPRIFQDGDGPRVYDAIVDAWLDTWDPWRGTYEEWAHWTMERDDFDPSLWFLVEDGGELAAFALCSKSWSHDNTGWVNILGVRRPWRRRGLGEALLRRAFAEFRHRGLKRAGLGVDAQSPTGATRLYERVGMRIFRETVFYEKSLDPA